MEIKLIEKNKRAFIDLLLLGDEQEDMIDKYLDRGTLYALYDPDLKSVCVITNEGDHTYEVQNLATYEHYQNRGYGKYLLKHVCNLYKDKETVILVGTGDIPKTITFYEKCGFVMSHRIQNFFVEHYDKPMFEEGKQLIDKVYLRME